MKRILVVDDNMEYLQLLATVLSDDFDTIKATGVKDALNILQTITVDAICSDFNMKDGTGLDLLEDIRQQSHSGIILITHDLGVVAETTYTADKTSRWYFLRQNRL